MSAVVAAADTLPLSARFAFPLNVYARMLERDEGRVDYLHYGLFEREGEPVLQAQERASARLWDVLPPPCRVLEVGIGVGTTLQRLMRAGYCATGITPDAAQVAVVRARLGAEADLHLSTLEALPPAADRFELMLLQESAQYIEPLALFEAADRLLTESACIVLMDEFAHRRDDASSEGLHLHTAFVALARRMGWTVEVDEDLSAQAAPTLAVIEALVRRQRDALLRELPVSADQLDTLVDSARRYRDHYARGLYGYRLMRLRRRARPPTRLAAVGPPDSEPMRVLFQRVFGHPMSVAEWNWKYGGGRGHAVGLWRDGALVAHYGAATRRVLIDGQVTAAAQVGDVMVLPEANAGLGRQGALQQVSATLLEQQIGWGAPHRLGFGFPNARAMRLAERLQLYAPVDEIIQLEWAAPPLARTAADALWRVQAVDLEALDESAPAWAHLQAAWQAMAAGLSRSLLPVRDAAWLRHRYGNRPGVRYRLMMLRHRLGLHRGGAWVQREHDDHVELMDLIGAPELLARLVRHARRATGGHGPVRAWITRSHADWLDDPRDPALRVDVGVKVPTSVHTPGPAPASLRGRWFLMGGDTDFR